MKKVGGDWTVIAAGPTTSARMEIFQDNFIEAFRPGIIIGKGGMGDRTSKACQEYGCVYGAFTGGAALLSARGIKKVRDVFWFDELGMPECLWVYDVEDFGPMIITNRHVHAFRQRVRIGLDRRLVGRGREGRQCRVGRRGQ